MAKHGPELLPSPASTTSISLYEASVGGGIPIIAPLKRDLLANDIIALTAIINGTTNYILTAMSRDGADFADALAGPRTSVTPSRTRRTTSRAKTPRYKLAILASLAFHTRVHPDDIYREGITKLTAKDFRYAAELGYAIKLLAMARSVDGGIQLRVHPALHRHRRSCWPRSMASSTPCRSKATSSARVLFQGRGAGPAAHHQRDHRRRARRRPAASSAAAASPTPPTRRLRHDRADEGAA